MIEINHILCPIDLSESSRRALQYAAATARWYGSRLTVLHVWRYLPPVDIIPLPGLQSQRIGFDEGDRKQLTEAAHRFVHGAVGQTVHVDLIIHDAPQVHREIVDQAEAGSADLVIMGSHGRSGYERFLLGSTAEKVLRTARPPVMIVSVHADAAVPAGDVQFDSVLCAVDFSDSSLSALSYAMSFAQEADARLTVVNVIELGGQPALDGKDEIAAGIAQALAAARATNLERLRALIPDSVRTYCHVETTVEEGKPYREILRLAAERRADLIVMGVQSHGPIDRVLFGSNTNHVVRAACCPVLTVRGR